MMECSASFFGLIDLYTAFIFFINFFCSCTFLLLSAENVKCMLSLEILQHLFLFACGVSSYTFSSGSFIILVISLSQTISAFLSLSSLLFFRLAWIAWYSQTLVWLVRPHPLFPFFSCLSCDMLCCGFVRCGSFMCCETYSNKYLTRRYFMSNVMPGWIYS